MTLTETPPEQGERRARPVLERLVRVAGVVVSLLATVVTAVAEIYLTPLRVAGVPTGAAILFAGVANWAICRFALVTTGRRWSLAPPWALWTLIMLFAAGARRYEGDYLIGDDNWVGLVMILVGSLIFAVCAYRAILRPSVGAIDRPRAELRDDPPADR